MALRDSSTIAFRKYARLCRDADEISYFSLSARLKGCCKTEREALKILAVKDLFDMLRASGKSETVDAVKAAYFVDFGRTPRKSDVSDRVRKFAFEHNMDDRTVFRRIEEAKKLYENLVQIRLKGAKNEDNA
ncbi:MAG: hypothetical protein J5894_00500 [Clostridia bacterium]|nr:hypothetical protein [Clostridia bacterium]